MTSNLTYVPTQIHHNPKQRLRSAAHAQRLASRAYADARDEYNQLNRYNQHKPYNQYTLDTVVEHQVLGAQLSRHARLCMGMKD